MRRAATRSAFSIAGPLLSACLLSSVMRPTWAEESPTPSVPEQAAAPAQPAPKLPVSDAKIPENTIALKEGDVHSVMVKGLQRVAIGDPKVADFTIVSPSELLLQAKAPGTTNMIIWDERGQRAWTINVVNRTLDAVEEQLHRLLGELNLPKVQVKREPDKLFLVGEVASKEDQDRLQHLVDLYPDQVVNLTMLAVAAPAPLVVLPELVRLAVQVVELNRSDLEKLGVQWSEALTLTDTAAESTNKTLRQQLLHWGTSVNRTDLKAVINALVTKNRARILAEPKLVTASNKKASSFIGVDVPIITSTSETGTGTATAEVEFRKTGVLLTMTPVVHAGAQNRKITTTVDAEISGIDAGSALTVPTRGGTITVPGFKTRKVTTEVTSDSGETVVIAGLLEAEDSKIVSQVPALGSMPVIGRLFRSPTTSSTEREIIIAITPELLVEENQTTDRVLALEQALGKPRPDDTEKPLYRYAIEIQKHLARGIGYPEAQNLPGTSGRVTLRLHIRENGELAEVILAESSGIAPFDQEAVAGAKRVAPYPPIPKELEQHELWLDIPVIFNPLVMEDAVGEALSKLAVPEPIDTPARRYAMKLQDRLAQNIKYPEREKAMGASGQVMLRLHVARDGKLADAQVAQSSGLPSLDRAAVEAAKRVAPFPPFPAELAQPDLWLDLPVFFNP